MTYGEIADQLLAAMAARDRVACDRLRGIMRAAWLAEAELASREPSALTVLRRHFEGWPLVRCREMMLAFAGAWPIARQFFDHPEGFKTAEGFAIVCHLYDCDEAKQDKCRTFAQAIGAEVEFPPALSWWFPGRTTLVVWRLPPRPLPGRDRRMREWLRRYAPERARSVSAFGGRFYGALDLEELAGLQERFLRWELKHAAGGARGELAGAVFEGAPPHPPPK